MSKKQAGIIVLASTCIVAIAAGLIFKFVPRLAEPGNLLATQITTVGLPDEVVRADVLEILEQGEIQLGDSLQSYQILLIRILEGPASGQLLEIDLGRRRVLPEGMLAYKGDQILVTIGQLPDGSYSAYFTDFVRWPSLLALFLTFVFFSILISGWKGVRSLLAMFLSLAVILVFIIPEILAGNDPLLISISGSFVILAATIYLTYGWSLKSHAAVSGTFVSLLLTGFLAVYFVDLTRLTGFGSEDALFLFQQSTQQINLRGLVLGGMLIGALGVLDDLVITQASAVFELYHTDPKLPIRSLIGSAMRIGQDHVAATVNTLVLAYAGATLPALLLFTLSRQQIATLLNLEFIAEEIVRTLVGSLGLIAAVPITTALAALLAVNSQRIRQVAPYLGPAVSRHLHTHD